MHLLKSRPFNAVEGILARNRIRFRVHNNFYSSDVATSHHSNIVRSPLPPLKIKVKKHGIFLATQSHSLWLVQRTRHAQRLLAHHCVPQSNGVCVGRRCHLRRHPRTHCLDHLSTTTHSSMLHTESIESTLSAATSQSRIPSNDGTKCNHLWYL